MKVIVEVSARHIHLAKSDYEILFGHETKFENLHELSQHGEFATDKILTVRGPKGSVEVRFLSPFRDLTQVELSLTDCYEIGISAPYEIKVADGGSLVKIIGPVGEIEKEAAIVARRHVHCNPNEAKQFKFTEGQKVSVETETNRGKIRFENVQIKIKSHYQLRVHLDTDEGNAAGIEEKTEGELIVNNG